MFNKIKNVTKKVLHYIDAYKWCFKYKIPRFYIKNNELHVLGTVNLKDSNLEYLPFKFNSVSGDFIVPTTLKSLKNSPTVVGGDLIIKNNKYLKSLKKSTTEVRGNFECLRCPSIRSFTYAPSIVYGNIIYDSIESSSYKGVIKGKFIKV